MLLSMMVLLLCAFTRETYFTIEELLAMILDQARQYAQEYAGESETTSCAPDVPCDAVR